MEVIPNSYIARVVLAYLYEEKLNQAAVEFCKTSPYLHEERKFIRSGYRPASCINLKLTTLFREYFAIQMKLDNFVEKYGTELELQNDLPLVKRVDVLLSLAKRSRLTKKAVGGNAVPDHEERAERSKFLAPGGKRKRNAVLPSLSSSTMNASTCAGEPPAKRPFIVLSERGKNLPNESLASLFGGMEATQESAREEDDEEEEEGIVNIQNLSSIDQLLPMLLKNKNHTEKTESYGKSSLSHDPQEGTSGSLKQLKETVEAWKETIGEGTDSLLSARTTVVSPPGNINQKTITVLSDVPYYGGISAEINAEYTESASNTNTKTELSAASLSTGSTIIQAEATSADPQLYVIQPDNTLEVANINQLEFPIQEIGNFPNGASIPDSTKNPENTFYPNSQNCYLDSISYPGLVVPEQILSNPTIPVLPGMAPSSTSCFMVPSSSAPFLSNPSSSMANFSYSTAAPPEFDNHPKTISGYAPESPPNSTSANALPQPQNSPVIHQVANEPVEINQADSLQEWQRIQSVSSTSFDTTHLGDIEVQGTSGSKRTPSKRKRPGTPWISAKRRKTSRLGAKRRLSRGRKKVIAKQLLVEVEEPEVEPEEAVEELVKERKPEEEFEKQAEEEEQKMAVEGLLKELEAIKEPEKSGDKLHEELESEEKLDEDLESSTVELLDPEKSVEESSKELEAENVTDKLSEESEMERELDESQKDPEPEEDLERSIKEFQKQPAPEKEANKFIIPEVEEEPARPVLEEPALNEEQSPNESEPEEDSFARFLKVPEEESQKSVEEFSMEPEAEEEPERLQLELPKKAESDNVQEEIFEPLEKFGSEKEPQESETEEDPKYSNEEPPKEPLFEVQLVPTTEDSLQLQAQVTPPDPLKLSQLSTEECQTSAPEFSAEIFGSSSSTSFPITTDQFNTPKSLNFIGLQSISGSSYYKPDESDDVEKNLKAMFYDDPGMEPEKSPESSQSPPPRPLRKRYISVSDSSDNSDTISIPDGSECFPETNCNNQQSSTNADLLEEEARRLQKAELEAKRQRTIARLKVATPPPSKAAQRQFVATVGFKSRRLVVTSKKNCYCCSAPAANLSECLDPRKMVMPPSKPKNHQLIEGTYEDDNLARLRCSVDQPGHPELNKDSDYDDDAYAECSIQSFGERFRIVHDDGKASSKSRFPEPHRPVGKCNVVLDERKICLQPQPVISIFEQKPGCSHQKQTHHRPSSSSSKNSKKENQHQQSKHQKLLRVQVRDFISSELLLPYPVTPKTAQRITRMKLTRRLQEMINRRTKELQQEQMEPSRRHRLPMVTVHDMLLQPGERC